ncbi:4'-phosphopantetheinyl transferase superfamily protein [Flavobacterium sp. SM15]|uniref:4'-phosphopantetheinyl transferase family protein n=1 Tax=Flavobacterium sp. SM15 TaxID=2908005 RepID=UPI001EDA21F1|nr:4'-phosphopantetheinyl transferase superfamily protein [Flavobacterium sp. SM15]MCG2610897.1 4'-phosphopantetheinyl transferase superfamily protein [Flavobacterium sp. SM15]
MSFFKVIHIDSCAKVFLWKITEDFDWLFRETRLKDVSLARLEGMKSKSHQKGFLSVRMLLQHCGYSDFDLYYDQLGKPHLKDGTHISISHSFDFSAIVLSEKNIGLDIEQVKEKVLRIAPRFMNVSHLEHLTEADQTKKATVIWGIKEAIFKLKNEIGISFPDHIFEDEFLLTDKKCNAQLRFNNTVEHYKVCFEEIENYMLVCVLRAE